MKVKGFFLSMHTLDTPAGSCVSTVIAVQVCKKVNRSLINNQNCEILFLLFAKFCPLKNIPQNGISALYSGSPAFGFKPLLLDGLQKRFDNHTSTLIQACFHSNVHSEAH